MKNSSKVYADLHIHTKESNGNLTLKEVPVVAKNEGVSVVAITDHDCIHPEIDSPVINLKGVTVIRGIELRVEPESMNERIDLLGYFVSRTEDLQTELKRLQNDRIERAEKIINFVQKQFGVELDIETHSGIGRPHIAKAIDESEKIPPSYSDAFEDIISKDGPCYVERDATSFKDGVELLSDACEVVSLAHPYRYGEPEKAIHLAQKELDGVEFYYPYSNNETPNFSVLKNKDFSNLLLTGGSDSHDKNIGQVGLPKYNFDRFTEKRG